MYLVDRFSQFISIFKFLSAFGISRLCHIAAQDLAEALPADMLFQMIILAPSDKRNIVLFAVVAVVFTLLVFFAFRLGLSQPLPRGPIESLLGF